MVFGDFKRTARVRVRFRQVSRLFRILIPTPPIRLPGAQGLSLSSEGPCNRPIQSGGVRRYDLHPDEARLLAVMDSTSRKGSRLAAVRARMDADFCGAALEEAIARFGKPDIFNTDQGSQFTSQAFTGRLE